MSHGRTLFDFPRIDEKQNLKSRKSNAVSILLSNDNYYKLWSISTILCRYPYTRHLELGYRYVPIDLSVTFLGFEIPSFNISTWVYNGYNK